EETFISFEHGTVHSHGKAGEHAHEGLDGHTWIDPVNARIQANELKNALTERIPEHEAVFEKGFAALAKELDALNETLKGYQAAYKNQPLLASHPAYNYIARRYEWNIKNLDLDPEAMPSDETFQGIKEMLKHHPAKHLIWEAYPTQAIADRMQKELGLISIEFSPCELLSEDAQNSGTDYMRVMQRNLENISVVFD
ncbi:MAG: zinc ABC transporter solute-binding protein, partial [Verrucomicrobia bacterium]|nr:zinc ABC transporter solute-binding protein [Verrucomicrobiota bacterium]